MSTTPITERIKQLLAIAENDAATPAERELAESRATRLIEQHDIDVMRDLEHTAESIKFGTVEVAYLHLYEARLAYTAATRAGAKMHRTPWKKTITFFGTEAQNALGLALFERWKAQLAMDLHHDRHQLHGRNDYNTYRAAWGVRVTQRVSALLQEEAREPGTELVLLKSKQDEAYREAFPRLTTSKSRPVYGAERAAKAGSAAGDRASLSYGVGAGAKGALR